MSLFPTGHLFAGVVVCTGFVLTDMLDGTLARIKGTTGKFGAFLDSTMDRVADAAVFAGLAAWFVLGGHDRLLAGVSVFCLVAGALVSYAKARAESLGLSCDVGFAERTERLLIGLVAAGLAGLGVPYVLPIGLWLLAAVSTLTFGQRVLAARRSAAEIAAAEAAGVHLAPGPLRLPGPLARPPGLRDCRRSGRCRDRREPYLGPALLSRPTATRRPSGRTSRAGPAAGRIGTCRD